MTLTVGVLALQGGVEEHLNHLNKIENISGEAIKKPEQLADCSGLIIPGGESTVIRKLINKYHFFNVIKEFAAEGKQIWGTCAGLILLAREVENEDNEQLNLINIKVKRNAFGSQLNSFISTNIIPEFSAKAVELVYIRAPLITEAAADTKILYQEGSQITAVENENILATSFHPELSESLVFHQYFVNKITTQL